VKKCEKSDEPENKIAKKSSQWSEDPTRKREKLIIGK